MISFTRFALRELGLRFTLGQFVLSRIAFDGCQIGDLPASQQEIAKAMFGEITISDSVRDTLVLRCGRGSGKSTISAAGSLYKMVTVDLSKIGPGDFPAVLVICPDKGEAEDTLNKARAMVEGSKRLRPWLVRNVAQGFHLLRPDGVVVRFLCIAKSARGRAGRGKSIIQCIIDESEFIASSDPSKIVRDVDIINAIMPRLMEGGRLILASTPWPAESRTSQLFDENFLHPATALCARAPTLLMRDNDPFWVNKRAKEFLRDPGNAEREYDCIPRSAEGSFFDSESIDRAISDRITTTYAQATAGIDLGFRRDASAIVVVEQQESRLAVVALQMDSPKKNEPLVPSVICAEYALLAKRYSCNCLIADAVYVETAREIARSYNLPVLDGPSVKGDKESSHIYLRDLLREGKITLPNDSRLLSQLKSYLVMYQSGGGLRFIPPRSLGNHCDLVSALVNAVWGSRQRYGSVLGDGAQCPLPSFVPRVRDDLFSNGSVFR